SSPEGHSPVIQRTARDHSFLLSVRVARATPGDVPGTVPPARPGGSVDLDALHHARSDPGGDLVDELALEQPQLSGPRRRVGLHGELAVLQCDGLGVFGDLGADQLGPFPEDRPVRQVCSPFALTGEPLQHATHRLWIAVVRAGTGPPASTTAQFAGTHTLESAIGPLVAPLCGCLPGGLQRGKREIAPGPVLRRAFYLGFSCGGRFTLGGVMRWPFVSVIRRR